MRCDVFDGRGTPERAETDYGVKVHPDGNVDAQATAKLRSLGLASEVSS